MDVSVSHPCEKCDTDRRGDRQNNLENRHQEFAKRRGRGTNIRCCYGL